MGCLPVLLTFFCSPLKRSVLLCFFFSSREYSNGLDIDKKYGMSFPLVGIMTEKSTRMHYCRMMGIQGELLYQEILLRTVLEEDLPKVFFKKKIFHRPSTERRTSKGLL